MDGADRLLAELRLRRTDPEDTLGAEVIDALAQEMITLRTAALLHAHPLPPGKRGDFLRNLAPDATWSDWTQDVPASITLAQAILESNWGRSAPGFNLFGLKGKGTAGGERRRVVEYRKKRRFHRWDTFRTYYSMRESVEDHAKLLATSRHYARARAVAEDADAYARALQGVYASDPRYATKLSGIMADLDLYRFNWGGTVPFR